MTDERAALATEAGKRLASTFPFTITKQTCCPYPHGPESGPDIVPPHTRTTETTHHTEAILAIEDEARALPPDPTALAVAMHRHYCGPFDCTHVEPFAEDAAAIIAAWEARE